MRKNFGAKEWLYPMPVLIVASYDKDGTPDAMNAAWGSISDEKEIGLCLSASHKTVKNILERKAFTVSVGTAESAKECDYVGLVSANNTPDKFTKAGFHAEKSEFVDAPLIRELPFALECNLISYDEKTSHLFGQIVNVSIDDSVLDSNGKVDVKKLNPISYDPVNQHYLKLGDFAGKAFSIGLELK
ncbi:flavin reductase family protein [uncultured Treponema sp.]|uniref:flavin reductase family protein n=1 Tax=uncultured Treponema sp. TaxID=162155 RepID=UPI00258CFF38|nr:flavin reductase family protein [uncultured Treponema sp.]